MKKDPLSYSLEDIRTCLSPDTTILNNYNVEVRVAGLRAELVLVLLERGREGAQRP